MTYQTLVITIVLCLLCSVICVGQKGNVQDTSPYNQGLPNCGEPFKRIEKKTNAKAILCPMIR